jgi:hypothetical protein
VVVIARGADAHNHFPAAVAGRIYRDLNGRFGTPANLQIATTRKAPTSASSDADADDEEEEDTTAVSKTWKEANNIGGISRTRDAQPLARTSSRAGESRGENRATDNKIKPVLMQIPSRNPETVRPIGTLPVTPSNTPERETRPRRVFGER